MRYAIKVVAPGEYDLRNNNCQHYADKLRETHEIFKDSPEIKREIDKEGK